MEVEFVNQAIFGSFMVDYECQSEPKITYI